ncbi:hypothetical protein [Nocardia brevicatena]|uniref:hypothetical protein n=1 Tax=Nocardia brevicatena TaxID=37327 RepID=UPI000310A34E|nr:hypothetical protein [Nocardia brevicatena]
MAGFRVFRSPGLGLPDPEEAEYGYRQPTRIGAALVGSWAAVAEDFWAQSALIMPASSVTRARCRTCRI